MIKLLSILLILATPTYAVEKQIRVAILDTGLDLKDPRFTKHLCKDGHRDLTNEGIEDVHGHGTHIAGLIVEYAKNSNYCLIILKYWSKNDDGRSYLYYHKALSTLNSLNLDFVNFSGGGNGVDLYEAGIIKKNKNIMFVVAAGNENKNLDVDFYFPASYNYKNMFVVGALNHLKVKQPASNYGKLIDYWEYGENIYSTLPGNRYGYLSGTSQSTAITTGKLIKVKYDESH